MTSTGHRAARIACRCLSKRHTSTAPAQKPVEGDLTARTALYSSYKSPHALSPSGPLYVEPTKEDWEKERVILSYKLADHSHRARDSPQLAGLRYPRFEGELWRYSRHLRKGGYPWQDSYQKRQFGEPLHYDDQALWVFGPEIVPDVTRREIIVSQLAFFGFVALVSAVAYWTFTPSPLVAKEYPHGGLSVEMGSLDGISRAHEAGSGLYEYSLEEEE